MDTTKLHGMAEAVLSAVNDRNYPTARDLAQELFNALSRSVGDAEVDFINRMLGAREIEGHVDDVRDNISPKNLLEDMANIEFMLDDSQFEAAELQMKLVNLYAQIGIVHSLKRIAETLSVTQP